MEDDKIQIISVGIFKFGLIMILTGLFFLNYINLNVFILGGIIILFYQLIAFIIFILFGITLVIFLSPFLLIGFLIYLIWRKFS